MSSTKTDRAEVPTFMVTLDGKMVDVGFTTWERSAMNPNSWDMVDGNAFQPGLSGYVRFIFEFPFGCRQTGEIWYAGGSMTLQNENEEGPFTDPPLSLSRCVTPRSGEWVEVSSEKTPVPEVSLLKRFLAGIAE